MGMVQLATCIACVYTQQAIVASIKSPRWEEDEHVTAVTRRQGGAFPTKEASKPLSASPSLENERCSARCAVHRASQPPLNYRSVLTYACAAAINQRQAWYT